MSDKERADRATELLRRFFEEFKGPDNMSDDSQICREIEAFLNPVPPPPDFREPWIASECGAIKNRSGSWLVFDQREVCRIVECVNACAGMRDPAAEIAALKAAANKTTTGPT